MTAAYGNILPYAFLVVPRCGTLNVHPSLLPRYRGAAPVQRALQVHRKGPSACFMHACINRTEFPVTVLSACCRGVAPVQRALQAWLA